ncbi:hypothetical protein AMIS_44350 [Actinoplanes missouriensis 431]|uniref:HEAT repeat-containing protein n=2 Tax=Actinoplanes missouriensis TaxID=1866 RepID=I0H9G8_ACTM4|nr:hypothetical protein AMIS_44350 [Actinoplanes missouriensis 431]
MARGDWEAGDVDEPWLPEFDVRAIVAALPRRPVTVDDFVWDESLRNDERLVEVRDGIRGLIAGEAAAVTRALSDLRGLTCDDGVTGVFGACVVPSLIRLAEEGSGPVRTEALQLAGDLARMDVFGKDSRSGLLRTMGPLARYDSWGYLENWAVEAVRMMIGRDAGPLITLLNDDDPHVRGRAAYVLVTSLPAGQEIADALWERLGVERDPAVQMDLVVGLAQHDNERDQLAQAMTWTRTLWSEPASASGARLGAVVAWLALMSESAPPELRRVLVDMPMPATYELLRQLAWIWWVDVRPGRLVDRWQDLTRGDAPGW